MRPAPKLSPFYLDEERPFAQRTDGMSLDIIHPKDIPRGKIPFIKDEDRSLKTGDIERAVPHYPHLNYLQKPDYCVGSTDPDHFGGRARTYYAPMDRRPRDLSLTTADIEYAQSRASKFKGNRHTDPVCPNYELPSTSVRPITPPRWNGRHLHDISDIEKSNPTVRIPTRNYVRDPNDGSDIEFASANYQERVHRRTRGGKPDITMNVKDINQTKKLHYAPRCVNPLDPEYKVSTTATTSLHTKYTEEMGRGVELHRTEAETHGFVHGSKPRKLQWDNGEPQFSLVREDIAGTVPQRWIGAVPINIYDPPEVKPVISFHDPHDIPGAQVGTLKKGIEASRRAGTTNPLNPRYKMLDGDARPQPVPQYDAERQFPTHPLQQARAQASSLPNLRADLRTVQLGTPPGSVPPSQRSMRRDQSAPALRQYPGSGAGTPGGRVSNPGTPGGQRYAGGGPQPGMQIGRAPSGRGTPSGNPMMMPPGQTGPPGAEYRLQGNYGPQGGNYESYAPGGPPPSGGRGQYYEDYQQPQESYGGPRYEMPSRGQTPQGQSPVDQATIRMYEQSQGGAQY